MMAIPFNVENDSDCDEAVLQLLLSDLCRTLQQIAAFQRSRRTQNLNRAQTTTGSRHSSASSETERTLLNSTVDLALSLSQSQHEIETLHQNASVSTRRRHRRRSRSEPSCCKEPKPVVLSVAVEVTNKEWIQKEHHIAPTTKKPWYSSVGSDGLLSKFIPAQLSGPLWTAVICMVGWHLLRTR